MLIKNVDIFGECLDVRVDKAVISQVGRNLSGIADIDGTGCALIPGLHDHHIHLNAAAASLSSVKCGPPHVRDEQDLITRLHASAGSDWIRGIGYHQSVAGEIDRAWLDRHGPNRPIRIQHRSGRLWILNSLGMDALGLTTPQDGRLFDADQVIHQSHSKPDLKALTQTLLSYGVTGVTEVTPRNGPKDFEYYLTESQPLHLCVMGSEDLTDVDHPSRGALKLHYHDYDLPSLDALTAEIAKAHEAGRSVAAHCVTRTEIMLTLAALEAAGALPEDRIEHAAIADDATLEWIARLGLTVVTQPHFIHERAEAYRKDVPSEDHPHLWRLGSFLKAGIKFAAGSDAPFGGLDPWMSMAACLSRPDGFDPSEAISAEQALALYTKPAVRAGDPPRCIKPGQIADFCLLDRPWSEARQDLSAVTVHATWIAGHCVYSTMSSIRPQSKAV